VFEEAGEGGPPLRSCGRAQGISDGSGNICSHVKLEMNFIAHGKLFGQNTLVGRKRKKKTSQVWNMVTDKK